MPFLPRLGWYVGWEINKVFVKERLSRSADPQLTEIMWIGITVGTLRAVRGSGHVSEVR